MLTNGDIVSRVMGDGRFLNKDDSIPRRHVLNIAKQKAKTYMAHKLADNTLFKEHSLFSYLDCFKLEKVNTLSCGIPQLSNCSCLMKSVEKLPELIYSKHGDSIFSVTQIDNQTSLDPVNFDQYSNKQKRQYYHLFQKGYYFVKNDYLYTVDNCAEAVNVGFITLDKEAVNQLNGCEDCDNCKSLWEEEFVISDKIREMVIQETINEVITYIRGITPDENPNLDSNLKSRTVN